MSDHTDIFVAAFISHFGERAHGVALNQVCLAATVEGSSGGAWVKIADQIGRSLERTKPTGPIRLPVSKPL